MGISKWKGEGEQRVEGGSKSRKAVLWSWFEPGLRMHTDQDMNLAITFYNQVSALGNLSTLSSCVLYKWEK